MVTLGSLMVQRNTNHVPMLTVRIARLMIYQGADLDENGTCRAFAFRNRLANR